MIYLITSEEEFNIEQNISLLLNKHGENAEIIKFKSEALELLPNKLVTNSFFSENRIFIVKQKLQKISPETEKRLIDSLLNLSEETIVIFSETKKPKGKIYKFLKEKGKIIESSKPREKDIIDFIKKQSSKESSNISPLAAEKLLSYVGADYWQLTEEIKKLSLYKKGNKEDETIQVSDVDELVKASFENNIFELLDAISTKNTRKSQSLLNSFLESGENAIYILTMIARQFRNIAMAKLEPNINQNSLAKKASIHPFVAKKSIEQAKNFSNEEILNMYNRISKADLKLKSGFTESHVLEELIIES